jgi:hypothetical protein
VVATSGSAIAIRRITSALSGPREAVPARRRRKISLRACGALAQTSHGPLQRIVRLRATCGKPGNWFATRASQANCVRPYWSWRPRPILLRNVDTAQISQRRRRWQGGALCLQGQSTEHSAGVRPSSRLPLPGPQLCQLVLPKMRAQASTTAQIVELQTMGKACCARSNVRDQRRRAVGAPLADRNRKMPLALGASGVTTSADRCIA